MLSVLLSAIAPGGQHGPPEAGHAAQGEEAAAEDVVGADPISSGTKPQPIVDGNLVADGQQVDAGGEIAGGLVPGDVKLARTCGTTARRSGKGWRDDAAADESERVSCVRWRWSDRTEPSRGSRARGVRKRQGRQRIGKGDLWHTGTGYAGRSGTRG